MSNSTHRVNIIKIEEIMKHPNADTLGIVYIGGYQVVVKMDDFKIGDLAIYIQPDTIVPVVDQFKFLWSDREFAGDVPEKYRRVTVRRFRKEWSEGMLMPISAFPELHDYDDPRVPPPSDKVAIIVTDGDDVAELLGFTHYEEPDPTYVVQKYNIVLTLDQNEAETLLAITGKIGGEPERTRRRFVDSIRRALILAGVNTVDAKFMLSLMNGVWFSTEGVV